MQSYGGALAGDASAVWKDASPAEVEKTLQEIHGITACLANGGTLEHTQQVAARAPAISHTRSADAVCTL